MDSMTKERSFTISKMELFEERNKTDKSDTNAALLKFVFSKQDLSGILDESLKEIKVIISRFSSKLSAKWEQSSRTRNCFLTSNEAWLESDIAFHMLYNHAEPSVSTQQPGPRRPKLEQLADASQKTKRRRVDDLVQSRSSEDLLSAAEISSRLSGRRTIANLLKAVSESSEKIRDSLKATDQEKQRCLSGDEALAYYVDSKSTTHAYKQNLEKFNSLTQETRSEYLRLYSWYYIPATVHKILVHGTKVIQSALLPIGQLSEETQEARNKDCRRFREYNTRKQLRTATNKDLLNMLLITSDPVINSLREIPKKKTGSLPSEVLDLVLEPSCVNRNIVHRSSVVENDYNVEDSSEEELSDFE